MEFVLTCNRPTVLAQGGFERLPEPPPARSSTARRAAAAAASRRDLLPLDPAGSLSDAERRGIEGHVAHTYRFLSQIPVDAHAPALPEIAYAHHEKLDGTGYPRAPAPENPASQSRMMAISDIYDALTASDRPYKKAVPRERALDILGDEAKRGQLDAPLLAVFVEAGIWKQTVKPA